MKTSVIVALLFGLLATTWLGGGLPVQAQDVLDKGNLPVGSVEERRLLYNLQEERARLQAEYEQKEENLRLKEIQLKTLENEVDKKLKELKTLRSEVEVLLGKKDEVKVKRAKELSKMYEKMGSGQAASLLLELDTDLAVRILSGMKPKSAGRILDSLPADKGAELTEAYTVMMKN